MRDVSSIILFNSYKFLQTISSYELQPLFTMWIEIVQYGTFCSNHITDKMGYKVK